MARLSLTREEWENSDQASELVSALKLSAHSVCLLLFHITAEYELSGVGEAYYDRERYDADYYDPSDGAFWDDISEEQLRDEVESANAENASFREEADQINKFVDVLNSWALHRQGSQSRIVHLQTLTKFLASDYASTIIMAFRDFFLEDPEEVDLDVDFLTLLFDTIEQTHDERQTEQQMRNALDTIDPRNRALRDPDYEEDSDPLIYSLSDRIRAVFPLIKLIVQYRPRKGAEPILDEEVERHGVLFPWRDEDQFFLIDPPDGMIVSIVQIEDESQTGTLYWIQNDKIIRTEEVQKTTE